MGPRHTHPQELAERYTFDFQPEYRAKLRKQCVLSLRVLYRLVRSLVSPLATDQKP